MGEIYLKSFTRLGGRMPQSEFVNFVKKYQTEQHSTQLSSIAFSEIAERIRSEGWYIQPLWGNCSIEETIGCAIFDCYQDIF